MRASGVREIVARRREIAYPAEPRRRTDPCRLTQWPRRVPKWAPTGRPMPPPPLISRDPEGYYARLGVDPWSGPATITAAYRSKARLVHPDVPGTGDANAFVELKQAYDVLISPVRRAAYDRLSLRQASAEREPGEIGSTPFPEMVSPPTRHPRLRDLPVAVWAGMAAVLMVGAIEIALHLTSSPPPAQARGDPGHRARTCRRSPPNRRGRLMARRRCGWRAHRISTSCPPPTRPCCGAWMSRGTLWYRGASCPRSAPCRGCAC